MAFTTEQFEAAAQWWADHLPGGGQISSHEAESLRGIRQAGYDIARSLHAEFSLPGGISPQKPPVPEKQRKCFAEILAGYLLVTRHDDTLEGKLYIELATDYGPMTAALAHACQLAKVDGLDLPFKTSIYLQDDGQILVPGKGQTFVPLDYPGRPKVAYLGRTEADFSGCPYYMQDKRYIFTDLVPGQEFITVRRLRGAGREYRIETAGENQVLVVPRYGTRTTQEFNALTQKDVAEAHSSIWSSDVWDRGDVCDGVEEKYGQGGRVEKLDDEGRIRVLSRPFRVKEMTERTASGFGSNYMVLEPGDFMTKDDVYASVQFVRKSALDPGSGSLVWIPSTSDGKPLPQAKPSGRTPSFG